MLEDIRSAERRHFSAEDKIRIVLEGLRGGDSMAQLSPDGRNRPELVLQLVRSEAGHRPASSWRLASADWKDTSRAATTKKVKGRRSEARDLNVCGAYLTLKKRLLKKHDRVCGRRRMRYPASEKRKIIRTVKQEHLSCWNAMPVAQRAHHLSLPICPPG